MGRRSAEAHALQSNLFRHRIEQVTKPKPVVCNTCAGFGEVKAAKHDEGEICPTCGGLGFELE